MLTLRNPATEAVIHEMPHATVDDVDAAIAAAKAASPAWRALSPVDRTRLLRRFADTIGAHADELAELETRNMGIALLYAHYIGFEAFNPS